MPTKIAAHQIKGVYKILNLDQSCENWKIQIYLRAGRGMIFPRGKTYLSWRQFTEEAQALILKSIEDCICYTKENGCNYACPCHNPFMSGVCSNCVEGKKRSVDDIEKALTAYFKRQMNKQTAEMWEKNKNEDLLGVLNEFPNSTAVSVPPPEKLIEPKELEELINSLESRIGRLQFDIKVLGDKKADLELQIREAVVKVDTLTTLKLDLRELLNNNGK